MARGKLVAVSVLAGALVVAALQPAGAGTNGATGGGLEISDSGVGKPPPGAGMGTKAALQNPKCNPDTIQGWGTFPMITTLSGPYCVAPAPKNNGGATYRGVTADTIKVVVIVPSPLGPAVANDRGSINRATGQPPTTQAAMEDAWAALSHVYETWGRKVELTFITSSGLGEAEQRADVVKVEAEKPMFVINVDSRGLPVLTTTLAKDKYVVYSYDATPERTQALAPYLWGQADTKANVLNAAEFIGKQVVGGKAKFAGDKSMQNKPRKFGLVYADDIDLDPFDKTFKQAGGTLATPAIATRTNGSQLGDAVIADEQTPTVITKLKDAGVTSVILFTDIATTGSLTKAATKQEFHPEWIVTGAKYQDTSQVSRLNSIGMYDQDQWAHAFGISNLPPAISADANPRTYDKLLNWYFGPTTGSVANTTQAMLQTVATMIMYAGPNLTPKNVQRGLAAVPGRNGAAWGDTRTNQGGFGLTGGLSYYSYLQYGTDYGAIWYDQDTVGDSNGLTSVAKGVLWYLDGGKRYIAGTWPTKPLPFFKKQGAVVDLPVDPEQVGTPVPCTGCPSEGGPGTASTAA